MTFKIPQKLLQELTNFTVDEKREIERAYEFAKGKHQGQKRKSGAPYITHPLRVATRIAKDNHDLETIIAALLHDTIEDTNATKAEISKLFGQTVANLVDGVTKIAALRTKGKSLTTNSDVMFLRQVDNYRKILLAGASDVRVMIIRMYDRLDNIATLQWIKPEKQRFYAQETIEIYAPIAERLGMGVVKGELEDLAFPYAYPKEYAEFIKIAKPAYKNPGRVIDDAIPVITKSLIEADIPFSSIAGRAKHLFSLYNKTKQGKSLSQIFDIIALRVIVNSVEDCYKALGLVHSLYQPIPGQIDDYIARPKESGYQSLHTTVKNEQGKVFEIQIRTNEMHEINEYGPAAHWGYKDRSIEKNLRIAEKNRLEWMAELEKVKNIQNNKEFIRQIKEEFFSRQIFVFTPKGAIIKLPSGSTGLDFAFQIHTDLGNRCSGIRINQRLMPLGTPLQTGDVVEIITSPKANPSRDWLKLVKTTSAKHHIRAAIRLQNFDRLVADGEKGINELILKYHLAPIDRAKASDLISASHLPYKDLNAALVGIAEGSLTRLKLLKIIYPGFSLNEKKREITAVNIVPGISSLKDIRHSFAGCCKPRPSDKDIIGYLTKEHIIKVHRKNCKRITSVDKRRLVEL